MQADGDSWFHRKVESILAGLEVGVLGGAAMLAWLAFTGPLIGHSWWWLPNLFASKYYTHAVVLYGPGAVTVSAAGLQVFWASLAGAFRGLFDRPGKLFGILIGMTWYLFCYVIAWRKYSPMVLSHGSQPLIIAGFYLFGTVLGWHSQVLARLRMKEPMRIAAAVGAPEPK